MKKKKLKKENKQEINIETYPKKKLKKENKQEINIETYLKKKKLKKENMEIIICQKCLSMINNDLIVF